jgi:hypothetical protein
MAKKSYGKPLVIDLSIEGVTGIGEGIMAISCNTGPKFTSASCSSYGVGFTGVCTITGAAPSFGCSDGHLPNYQGGYCKTGTATVGACNDGTGVTGSHSICSTGSNPSGLCYTGSSAQYTTGCTSGSSHGICDYGNSQIPFTSS